MSPSESDGGDDAAQVHSGESALHLGWHAQRFAFAARRQRQSSCQHFFCEPSLRHAHISYLSLSHTHTTVPPPLPPIPAPVDMRALTKSRSAAEGPSHREDGGEVPACPSPAPASVPAAAAAVAAQPPQDGYSASAACESQQQHAGAPYSASAPPLLEVPEYTGAESLR